MASASSPRPLPVRPCLIGGTGRSGTTVVRQVFSRHPDVATIPTEARFLVDPDGLVDFYDSALQGWSPYVYDARVRRLRRLLHHVGSSEFAFGIGRPPRGDAGEPLKERGHRRAIAFARETLKSSRYLPPYFNVDLNKSCPQFRRLAEGLMDRLTDFTFDGRWTGTPWLARSELVVGPRADTGVKEALATFFEHFLTCVAETQQATHVVEDSPFNLLAFDRTLDLAPEARLVHVYRDPRDVVASMQGMTWAPADPVKAAKLYARVMDEWARVRRRVPDGTVLEVRLEDLVARPAEVLSSICDHWELAWSPLLLETDLSHAHSGRWRRDIAAAAQPEVLAVLSPFVRRLGYDA